MKGYELMPSLGDMADRLLADADELEVRARADDESAKRLADMANEYNVSSVRDSRRARLNRGLAKVYREMGEAIKVWEREPTDAHRNTLDAARQRLNRFVDQMVSTR
jgi:hypothetical protein